MEKVDIETFVFVHDQDIIIEFELNNKFNGFDDYKYVFLGNGHVDRLKDFTNIIYATKLPYNLEKYPKMCSYSGWYVLYKNDLITKQYVNLFEYDVILTENFTDKQSSLIKDDSIDFYGYVPIDVRCEFIGNPNWVGDLFRYYWLKEKINLPEIIKQKIIEKNIQYWPSTSNITFNVDFFYDYMRDVEKIFLWMKEYGSVGHGLERLLSFYWLLNDSKMEFVYDMLFHSQLDSHKTQGIVVSDYKEEINKLSRNNR